MSSDWKLSKRRTGVCRRGLIVTAFLVTATGCTHVALTDCPAGSVLGNNEGARLKTAHYRVQLESQPAAAARFLPFASMSAHAYRVGDGCEDPGNKRENLANENSSSTYPAVNLLTNSANSAMGWSRVYIDARLTPKCEDDQGLMFHVWERRQNDRTEVAISFRGTSGNGDWIYGNLWPLTHLLQPDNQLTRAASRITDIIAHYDSKTAAAREQPAKIISTGHSLGGGLAQHVLYANPNRVEQAIVFDPSSITGFTSLDAERQIAGCSCLPSLGTEARIIRVYQTYEILTNLRIIHKTFFPPERHVQEVRFHFDSSLNMLTRHGMAPLAQNLLDEAKKLSKGGDTSRWFYSRAGTKDASGTSCTDALIKAQEQSCQVNAQDGFFTRCPS